LRAIVLSSVITFACSFAVSADTRISRGFVPVEEGVKVTEVVGPLEFPWGIVALPDGQLLITQRDGYIRIVEDGKLLEKVIKFPVEVFTSRSIPPVARCAGRAV